MSPDGKGGRRRTPPPAARRSSTKRPHQRAEPTVRRATVRLVHEVARRVRAGHPWIYREALDPRRVLGDPGTAVEVVDWDGEPVGRGLVDGGSPIAIRLFTRRAERAPVAHVLADNVRRSIARRWRFFDRERDQAIRLVNGDSEGVPAISVDRYGDYLVVQCSAAAMEGYLEGIYDVLASELSPAAIYVQRRFKSLAGEAPRGGAELVRGSAAPVELDVREGDLRFLVDVTAPLSTGLFTDLRDGRRAVAELSGGRRVLNLFSYTGALSLYALAGGASEVVAVDVSPKAHARARRNLALNGRTEKDCEHVVGDALKVLTDFSSRGRRFDLIVIDPPAFASGHKGGRPWSAIKDYRELVWSALQVLEPDGLVAAASSTRKVAPVEFDQALAQGVAQAGSEFLIVRRCGLPADYPVSAGFPDGNYLKFVVGVRD